MGKTFQDLSIKVCRSLYYRTAFARVTPLPLRGYNVFYRGKDEIPTIQSEYNFGRSSYTPINLKDKLEVYQAHEHLLIRYPISNGRGFGSSDYDGDIISNTRVLVKRQVTIDQKSLMGKSRTLQNRSYPINIPIKERLEWNFDR